VDEFPLSRGSAEIVYRQRQESFFLAKPELPEIEQMGLAHEELSEIEPAHVNVKSLRVVDHQIFGIVAVDPKIVEQTAFRLDILRSHADMSSDHRGDLGSQAL
jgi:hypothetical protein